LRAVTTRGWNPFFRWNDLVAGRHRHSDAYDSNVKPRPGHSAARNQRSAAPDRALCGVGSGAALRSAVAALRSASAWMRTKVRYSGIAGTQGVASRPN
jgi:hypothetical protein